MARARSSQNPCGVVTLSRYNEHLPPVAFTTIHRSDSTSLAVLVNGEKGHHEIPITDPLLANRINSKLGITDAELTAMIYGAEYGWNHELADIERYF
jgi:hypothetical protein